MKLAGKLILTILSALLAGALLWMSLPPLLIGFATQQLEARGFTNVDIEGLRIHLDGAEIDELLLSSDGIDISAQEIVLKYSLAQMSSGILDSIQANKLDLVIKDQSSSESTIPDTARIAGLLLTPWYNYLPAQRIEIPAITLSNSNDNRSTQAGLQLVREGDELNAAVEIRSSAGKPHRLTLSLSPEGELVTILRGEEDAATAPLVLVIVPGDQAGSLDSSLSADLTALSQLLPVLPADLKGHASLQASVEDEITSQSGNTRFSASGHLDNFSSAVLSAARIDLHVSGDVVPADNVTRIHFDENSQATSDQLEFDDVVFSKLVIHLPEEIAVLDGSARITAGRFVSSQHIRQGELVINDAAVTDLVADMYPATDNKILNGQFSLSVKDIQNGDTRLTIAPATMRLSLTDSGQQSFNTSATTSFVAIETSSSLIELEDCKFAITLPANRVQSTADCRYSQLSASASGRLDYDLASSNASITYQVSDLAPQSEHPLLRTLVKDWDEPYDLVSGKISASGTYRWSPKHETLDMLLSVSDAGGFYDNILFSGLNTEPSLTLLPDLATRTPASVSVDIFDVGIPVTDTQATISMKPSSQGDLPLVLVQSLTMQLLDGTVSGADIEYDFNSDFNEFTLNVEGLNLATTVAMQQVEGLEASGLMDGSIPVFIDDKGLRVINGELQARAPGGRIRYLPDGGTESMQAAAPGTNIVFDILEDLNYQTLETRMNYVPDGNLILNLAIRGRSPKLDEKRPIHFNLNLEQNVLQLLKSLRIADDIDNVLDKNVQEYYKRNN